MVLDELVETFFVAGTAEKTHPLRLLLSTTAVVSRM